MASLVVKLLWRSVAIFLLFAASAEAASLGGKFQLSPNPVLQNIGNGFNVGLAGNVLFATHNSLLIPTPNMSISGFFTYNGTGVIGQAWVQKNTNSTGYAIFNNNTQSNDMPFQFYMGPGSGGGCATAAGSNRACTRQKWILDGNLHHLCATSSLSAGVRTNTLYIDGYMRDQNSSSSSYTTNTYFFSTGVPNQSLLVQDLRIYNRGLTATECQALSSYGQAGKVPASGSINAGLTAWWPLSSSTCTGSNPTTCTEASGSGAPSLQTDTPPTVAVTAPTNGATITGTTSFTATCSDTILCLSVAWLIDGLQVAAPTVSPYTYSWDSTKIIDGSHTISAVGLNPAGQTTTATVTVTTSNGISATAYYFSNQSAPAASDTYDCQAPAFTSGTHGPCATLTKANSINPYRGGDSINFDAAHPAFLITSANPPLTLCGSGATGPAGSACTQNYFPAGSSAPLLVQSYGSGTCAPEAGTLTACATLQLDPATTYTKAVWISALSNVTVQNLQLIGGTASALSDFNGQGIYWTNSIVNANATFTNNLIKDFNQGIYLRGFTGNVANGTVTNNLITCSTPTSTCSFGMLAEGTTAGTFQGNVVTNQGGIPANPSAQGQGSGFLIRNSSGITQTLNGWTVQFNVIAHNGRNSNTCGGPAGLWAFATGYITWQFNEIYDMAPTTITGSQCDFDCIDYDVGVSFSTTQYNYCHNNAGDGIVFLNNSTSGPWSNNIARYNISENDGFGWVGTPLVAAFASSTPTHSFIYNNTVYNAVVTLTSPQFNSACLSVPNADFVVANNLCVRNTGATTPMNISSLTSNPRLKLFNNLYFDLTANSAPVFKWGTNNYASLAAFQAANPSQEVSSISSNPLLTSPAGGGTCYTTGTPAGPQPCPSAYVLSTTSSPAIGVGADLTASPYNQTITRDYYGNTVPHIHGTGWNIGADGGYP